MISISGVYEDPPHNEYDRTRNFRVTFDFVVHHRVAMRLHDIDYVEIHILNELLEKKLELTLNDIKEAFPEKFV